MFAYDQISSLPTNRRTAGSSSTAAAERAVAVAETREIAARQLAVEPGHVREQVTDAHVGRPDAGGVVEVEQPTGQQRRERLRDRRGAEPRVRSRSRARRTEVSPPTEVPTAIAGTDHASAADSQTA